MKKITTKFDKFYEANIRNNSGLDKDYIDDIKRKETQDAHRKIRTGEVEHPMNIMPLVEEIMSIQGGEIQHTITGLMPVWNDYDKKEKIENLARFIIDDKYKHIIDTLNIEMDIELIDPSKMDDISNIKGEMSDSEEPPKYIDDDDPDFKNDVDKRKIVNIITQGSAKNVHRIIHLYKDNIDEIDDNLFSLMDKLIKSNEAMEWTIPETNNNGGIIRQYMNGFSKTEFEDNEMPEVEDIDIDALLNGDEDEIDKLEEENIEFNGKIKVIARAIDLVVLLHESIKGIYEVLGYPSIPENDKQRANDIIVNTDTLDDEFIDLRYGVQIRKDLVEFINSNDKINEIENGIEYVWGYMVTLESSDFLKLFLDITTTKSDFSKQWLDSTLNHIIETQKEYEREMMEYEIQQKEYEDSMKYRNQSNKDVSDNEDGDKDITDYSKMSKNELQDLIDQSLDDNDFDKVKELSRYIKK